MLFHFPSVFAVIVFKSILCGIFYFQNDILTKARFMSSIERWGQKSLTFILTFKSKKFASLVLFYFLSSALNYDNIWFFFSKWIIIYSYETFHIAKSVPKLSSRYYVFLSSFVHSLSLIMGQKVYQKYSGISDPIGVPRTFWKLHSLTETLDL